MRVQENYKGQVSEEQDSFRTEKGSVPQIFNVRMVTDKMSIFFIPFEVIYLLYVRGRKEISSESNSGRETAVTSTVT